MQILQEQISVTTQPPDLLYRANSWSLLSCASSTLRLSLVSSFCSSACRFALRLPLDNTSQHCPCLRLVVIGVNNMVNVESSDRGLSPHKSMPMLGVHYSFERDAPKAARPSTLR